MTFIKNQPCFQWLGAILALLCTVHPAQAQTEPQHLPAITLSAGFYNITAEVATTETEREIGLMFRRQMPAQNGMLFVFEAPATQCFWMKNTLIPLSAAFIDEHGTVVNIEDMAPQTETGHCSARPVRFVLEMNQGWFAKRGMKAGFKLSGAPFR